MRVHTITIMAAPRRALAAAIGVGLLATLAAIAAAPPARATHQDFGPWSPATELAAVNSPALDGCPIASRDGKRLYIASTRDGGFGGIDIWVAERQSKHAPWGEPVNLGPDINTEHNEFCPSPGRGGRFMFVSNRPGGCGGGDIYATRHNDGLGWQPPENLGCTVNSAAEEAGPVRLRGELYFSSTRSGNSDIYVSPASGQSVGAPAPVAELNTSFEDARPYVRRDGLEIVFDSNRPNGIGLFDVWSAARSHRSEPWGQPVNLGAAVNSPAAETRPSLSSDGTVLYFGSTRGASQDVFTSTRSR
jgi:Tol biopolymer transport system component